MNAQRSAARGLARETLAWIASDARSGAPRTLLVVAHPDDETVGAGGRLADLDPIAIAIATDGAPRDPWFAHAAGCADPADYAQLRRRELEAALAAGGVPTERARFWGFVDQDAVRHLRELKQAVQALLVEHRPEVVLTHPYEGGHPDHDAVAFAVHAAAGAMAAPARPALLEMAYYHDSAGGEIWGGFAGHPGSAIVLDGPALARKHAMVGCYRSQERLLARFPLNVERVRLAPDYDFTAAPPPGRFHYDAHGWGVRGGDFLAAVYSAGTASDKLG
jgi:LmbE family N-acetylglucosaminyl deacetylase